MGQLLDILAADAAGNHSAAEAAFQALTAAQAAHPRFAATSCSQCGADTGPGDSGFSHCADHRARDAQRATLNSAGQAINAALRPAFDADYGSYTGHPMDPRTQPDEEVGDMLEQINCAERSLAMARQALEGYGNKVSTLTARSLFNEACDFLAVPR